MSVTQFTIPLWTDLTAVAIAAVGGAIFTSRIDNDRLDLLGVGLVGTATALGGAFLRDTLLDVPPAVLSNNWYLPVAAAAALAGMALERLIARLDFVWALLDALTIGLYAAIGMTKSLVAGLPMLPAIFVGCAAAVGGSAIRDVLLGVPVAMLRVGSLYAIAAAAGTVALAIATGLGASVAVSAAICVAVTTTVRIGSVRYGWSLPAQRAWEFQRRKRR
ncbi:trimeric intracellular cation channel family protein [Mycolicibacterium mengxianglii]|uniref:trimeric intracellular cation channel family protein n=1 Tax=Mycolicibacterium mengxianglii TaxID=2736649 RepID=UPI0018D0E6FF|nr:TRIC cation channel family protein [Mycolicibacterium mengxianglii]